MVYDNDFVCKSLWDDYTYYYVRTKWCLCNDIVNIIDDYRLQTQVTSFNVSNLDRCSSSLKTKSTNMILA